MQATQELSIIFLGIRRRCEKPGAAECRGLAEGNDLALTRKQRVGR